MILNQDHNILLHPKFLKNFVKSNHDLIRKLIRVIERSNDNLLNEKSNHRRQLATNNQLYH